jgi:hypothetical protein
MAGLVDVRAGVESYKQWATDPTPRIGLGLPFYDQRTNGGLAKAECMMVMAYSSVGKTSIALNMIANNPGVPTVFFSLEMSWRQVVARLTAIRSGLSTEEIEKELAAGREPVELIDTVRAFPLLLGNDTSELTIKDMRDQVLRDAPSRLGGRAVRLIVIDYLELIGGAGLAGKAEQVDKAATKIRSLAKDTDSSVVVLHQVGKTDGSAGHEPLALDSGKYGGHHPMDQVLGVYAPRLNRNLTPAEYESVKDELHLQLLKNRSTGRAHPLGVRHRLDPHSGRLVQDGIGGYGFQQSFPGAYGYMPDPYLGLDVT